MVGVKPGASLVSSIHDPSPVAQVTAYIGTVIEDMRLHEHRSDTELSYQLLSQYLNNLLAISIVSTPYSNRSSLMVGPCLGQLPTGVQRKQR